MIPTVRERLEAMKKGTWTRFDLFKGPIRDNQGNVVLEAGQTLTQEDLEGIKGIPGRTDCTTCMNWLVDGIVGRLP
mgnify:FL=1